MGAAPLSAAELAAKFSTLAAGDTAIVSAEDNFRWHAEKAAIAERRSEWFTATFHLQRLVQKNPDDARLKERLQKSLDHSRPPLAFSSAVADFQQAPPFLIANSLSPNVEGWGVFGGVQAVRSGYFIFSAPAYGQVLEITLVQNFGDGSWIQQFELAVTTDPAPDTAGGGNWVTWMPTTRNSTSTTLSLVGGTNIFSTGTAPKATYTLRGAFPAQGITCVRIICHPYDYKTDDALPATVGRSYNGNFVLSEIKAIADPR
jgi:hypothetical protein